MKFLSLQILCIKSNPNFIIYPLITFTKLFYPKSKMKRVLAVMSINPDYLEFAVPELKSVLSQLPIPFEILFKQQLTIQPKHSYEITHETLRNFPFVTLNVPDFQKYESFFKKACRQTVMLSKFILLISKAQSYEEMFANRDEEILKEKCRNQEQLIVCDFISRNRVLGRNHQIQKIDKILGDLDVRGKLDIKKPQKRYSLIQSHEWYQQHHESSVESTLKEIYFGVQLCTNRIGTARFNSVYELSKRIYLGPTSADNDLAFMMCNQGNIQDGSFVIDPFVGTGGLIIPPASKGAYVFGCDLDMRVLNGYSVGRINKRSPYYSSDEKFEIYTPKINLSFQQYGLSNPNIFRMDSTNLSFKKQPIFDAIITDPPYGLRAMSRSIGNNKKNIQENEQQAGLVQDQSSTNNIVGSNIGVDKQVLASEFQTKISMQQRENEQIQEKQVVQKSTEQIAKKKQKRKLQKQNKQVKRKLMTEDEKQFKRNITQKLNRQRIDNWDKYDKTKVQCTERQKIFQRLINFARTNLKQGGRLVFLYPIFQNEEYQKILSLPDHHGFQVVDMSQNKLSKNNSRILVTLEKQTFDLKK